MWYPKKAGLGRVREFTTSFHINGYTGVSEKNDVDIVIKNVS